MTSLRHSGSIHCADEVEDASSIAGQLPDIEDAAVAGQQVRNRSADELLKNASQGDWAAWHEIINRYRGLVIHTATRIGLSHSDAADVAQLTWLQLWKHGHQVRDPDRLAAWLVSTSRREAIRLATASRKYVLCADPLDQHSMSYRTAVRDVYPVEQGYDWAVEQALDRLPPRYRTLLRLLSSDLGLSYSEVADRMGLPIGSIGPMRMRAIRMLEKTPEFISGRFPRPAVTGVAS
jgi:RNA polymerase sigma factor (sigma-70 family)